jgi:hypothetical protein
MKLHAAAQDPSESVFTNGENRPPGAHDLAGAPALGWRRLKW